MKDNTDLYFGDVLEGKRSINDVGDDLLEEVLLVSNGKRTKAEVYGFGFTETVMSRACDYV
jgi:altronate dehydratase large subunit